MNKSAPVLFLFFNRPNQALRTFREIAKYKPRILYLSSDGARVDVLGEEAVVFGLREQIEAIIDWDVEVVKLYAPENQGCAKKVSEAITVALSRTGRLIVLEDDCLPAPEFFDFVEWGFKEYDCDQQVGSISGTRLNPDRSKQAIFSSVPHIWGWALWERGWEGYSLDMNNDLVRILDAIDHSGAVDHRCRKAWKELINMMSKNPFYTWDYQFLINSIRLEKLNLVPGQNLITNIGYGKNATHTLTEHSRFGELARENWIHTGVRIDICSDKKYSDFVQREYLFGLLSWRSLIFRIKRQILLKAAIFRK